MMVIIPILLLMHLGTISFSYPLESLKDISHNIEVNISLLTIYQRYNFQLREFIFLITNITNVFTYKAKEVREADKTFTYSDITVTSIFDMLLLVSVNNTANIILNRTMVTESYYASLIFKQNEGLSLSYFLSPLIKERFKLFEWDLVQYEYFKSLHKGHLEKLGNALDESFKDVINQTIKQYPLSIAEYYFKRLIANIERHQYYQLATGKEEEIYLKLANIKYKAKNITLKSKYQLKVNNLEMKAYLYLQKTIEVMVMVKEVEYGMIEIVMKEVKYNPKIIRNLEKYIKIIFYQEYLRQNKLDPLNESIESYW